MKNWNVWEWMVFMVLATVCIYILMGEAGMVILKIPTNADNKDLREQLTGMVDTMQGMAMGIVAMAIKDYVNKKDKL